MADPHDERWLPDFVSGVMWLATGLVGLLALALPGTSRAHVAWLVGLAAFAIAWGAVSLWLAATRRSMDVGARAAVTAGTLPIVGVALWATGGASSFLQPVLLFTALFIAYFFPFRFSWPLAVLFVLTYATPLLYDHHAVGQGYPARVAMFALGVAGETFLMRLLKDRLLRAEATQRDMAQRDALTGLANRRSFDLALADGLARAQQRPADGGGRGMALVIFDFDDFKAINDRHGHPAGDAVLRAVADACRPVVRESDCLARLGGDEFALVAPGAGAVGAKRLMATLAESIEQAEMPPGVPPVGAAFGWATMPEDAADPDELFRRADQRLLERKRSRQRPERRLTAYAAEPIG